jgi:hypothetical protein
VASDYLGREGEELRYEFCADIWRRTPAELRIPLLIETLQRYRDCESAVIREVEPDNPVAMIRSGKGLNDLIISAYRLASSREAKKLRMLPNEKQSLMILRSAHHYCGHGEDTAPPLRFALRHFRRKAYSDEFFDALGVYRECLAHTRHTATQPLRAEIDLILWQDLRKPGSECWSERIRRGLGELPGPELARWKDLFQRFCYSTLPVPPRHWLVQDTLDSIGRCECAHRLLSWINQGTSNRPVLTSPGSTVLKNLVWVAATLQNDDLDLAIHRTLFLPWKQRQPLNKVSIALAWMWSLRNDQSRALTYISEIVERFGDGGDQILRIWRRCSRSRFR